jgi:hypothetical protein
VINGDGLTGVRLEWPPMTGEEFILHRPSADSIGSRLYDYQVESRIVGPEESQRRVPPKAGD